MTRIDRENWDAITQVCGELLAFASLDRIARYFILNADSDAEALLS